MLDAVRHIKTSQAESVEGKAAEILGECGQLLQLTANRQITAATRQYEKKQATLRRDLAYVHDPKMRRRREEEMAALKEQFDTTVEELKTSDLRVVARCAGVVYLLNNLNTETS